MDIKFRNTLRQYAAEESDELAHKLARMSLRTEGDGPGLMKQFYAAYWWLHAHPLFRHPEYSHSTFPNCLEMHAALVDPQTRRMEDDKSRNTHVELWLEVMIEEYETGALTSTHYWELDCGGDTFEEGIINLANVIYHHRDEHPHPEPFPDILTPTPDCAVVDCCREAEHKLSPDSSEQFNLPEGSVICDRCYNSPEMMITIYE